MSHRSHLAMVLLAGMVLALGGCAAPPTPTPAPATAVVQAAATVEVAQSQFALAGTEWQLESLLANPVIPGTYPSLGFGVDRYTGYGGCDWFMGVYEAKGSALRMQTPASSRGGCTMDQPAASQQAAYASVLANVTEYAVEGDKLVLFTVDKQRLMTMAPLEAMPFEGTTWGMEFYFAAKGAYWVARLPAAVITAKFDGTQLTGSSGCNDYSAEYKRNDNRLTLGALTVTLKSCTQPEGVMDQEKAYLDLLRTAGTISQFPRSIELFTSDGTPLLMYHASAKPQ